MYKIQRLNEFNSFNPESTTLLVRLCGVTKEGDAKAKIDKKGNGYVDYQNLEEAQKDFPELDSIKGSKNFTMGMKVPGLQGYVVFSTWKHFKHNKFA
jgi:hypothetical protein